MKKGEFVSVLDYRNERLTRKVVEICGDTVYVCSPEEFVKAQELGLEPTCVGFNKTYVAPLES